MARQFLTTARRHGAESAEVLACPGVPFATQLADFKERVAAGRTDPDYAEVQIWASDDGVIKTAKFAQPDAAQPVTKKAEKVERPPVKNAEKPAAKKPEKAQPKKAEPAGEKADKAPAETGENPESEEEADPKD